MTRRTVSALAALVALVASLVLLTGGGAQAARSGVEVSLHPNGPFEPQLSTRLFHGIGRLVPGDRVERTFYLRNATTVDARTTVGVLVDGDEDLARALRVRVDVGGHQQLDGPLLAAGRTSDALPASAVIVPGEVQAITVGLRFKDVVGQLDMRQRVGLGLQVTLTEAADSGTGNDNGNGNGDGNGNDGTVVVTDPPLTGPAPCRVETAVPLSGTSDLQVEAPADGAPVCVPSAVDSGASGGGAATTVLDEPAAVASTALIGILAGVVLFLVAGRRRLTLAPRG